MNKRNSLFKKNRLLQSLKYNTRSGNKEGYCKYYYNNSDLHEDTKWGIFKKLKNLGFSVWTECEFNIGGRGDIVAIDRNGNGYIIEILVSETNEKYLSKKNKYPSEFKIISVDANEVNLSEWGL